jgi:ribonuclease III
MKSGDLKELQRTLGYEFKDPDFLALALTHASAAGYGSGTEPRTYQRLEFLGDRVLGLVVADMLERHLPQATEGDLARRLHRLVSGPSCAEVAREMHLDKSVRISGGLPTPSVLGDLCESVLGALYRDGGLEAARPVIERFWRPRLERMSGPPRDAKTELQEWAHRQAYEMPVYAEILRSGPDHAPAFEIEVTVGSLAPGRGSGGTKREAEQEAAADILRREGVWNAT